MTVSKKLDGKATGKTQAPLDADIGVTASELNMWRAIFACAHADNVVTQEERRFLRKAINSEPFSEEQRRVLEQDIEQGQSIAEMFALITAQKDRSRFFYFARMLFWCDGDFAEQEQKILTALAKTHFDSVKVDEIAESVKFEMEASGAAANKSDRPIESGGWTSSSIQLKAAGLELEDEQKSWIEEDMKNAPQKNDVGGIMDRFLGRLKSQSGR
jgi:hypothetical protein